LGGYLGLDWTGLWSCLVILLLTVAVLWATVGRIQAATSGGFISVWHVNQLCRAEAVTAALRSSERSKTRFPKNIDVINATPNINRLCSSLHFFQVAGREGGEFGKHIQRGVPSQGHKLWRLSVETQAIVEAMMADAKAR
jgi:hypothetical protein